MTDPSPRSRRSLGEGAGAPESAIERRTEFLRGLRVSIPLAAGVAAYGLVFGVLAREAGLSIADVALMSGVVFTGSAQFVALTLWAVSPPVLALAVTTLAVNLRYVLMAAALRNLFRRTPRLKAFAAAFLINDETWALTVAQAARGEASVGFMVGSSLVLYVAWLTSTIVGRVIGTAIGDPANWGVDFAFTATFLALLMGMVRGKRDILPWTVSAAVAVAASLYLPGKWYILFGGLAGASAGTLRRDA